jgi:hypothetical protein
MVTARFNYPPEFTSLPDHTAHGGQIVEILCLVPKHQYDFEGEPMFRIRACDGWEGDAWLSELDFYAEFEDFRP